MKLGKLLQALAAAQVEYGSDADVELDEDQLYIYHAPGIGHSFHGDKPSLLEQGWIIDGGLWTLIDSRES